MSKREKVQGFSVNDKSACIIGCGGLGCNIAVHMVGAGTGKLILCDFDTVDESNLNRQFLYTKDDIGKVKCEAAKKRLLQFSQNTEIESVNLKVESSEDLCFLENCDIILLAVDNGKTREIVQEFSDEKKIPLVCGGIDGFYGLAYLYVPGSSKGIDYAGFNKKSQAKYNISATAGIVGSAQSALALKYLLTGDKSLAGNILIYDNEIFDTLKIN